MEELKIFKQGKVFYIC